MPTLETFAQYFDISEQINCWPGELYTGDCQAFDTWLATAEEPTTTERQLLEAAQRGTDDAPLATKRGGYRPDGYNRIRYGEENGYEFYETTTTSTSVDLAILRLPSGRVVWEDTNGNRGVFSSEQFDVMPEIDFRAERE